MANWGHSEKIVDVENATIVLIVTIYTCMYAHIHTYLFHDVSACSLDTLLNSL